MAILEGNRYRLTDDLDTALRTLTLSEGDVFEVTDDPAEYDEVDEECLELLHEENFDLRENEHPAKPIVRREEFIDNTEEV